MAIWRKQDIEFALEDDSVDHPVATIRVDTPVGRLYGMAECTQVGRALHLGGLHVHGDSTSANQVGSANLMVLIQVFMETMDVDELVVTAGLRTTGANPGQAPRAVRFSRRPSADLVR